MKIVRILFIPIAAVFKVAMLFLNFLWAVSSMIMSILMCMFILAALLGLVGAGFGQGTWSVFILFIVLAFICSPLGFPLIGDQIIEKLVDWQSRMLS